MTTSSSKLLLAVLGLLEALASPVSGASFAIADEPSADREAGGLIRRSATLRPRGIWPGATIPYVLTGLPHWVSEEIRGSMRIWEQSTCVRFVAKNDSHPSWARFTKKDGGCWAEHWHSGGEVIVNFDLPNALDNFFSLGIWKGCGYPGIALRQVGTVVGLIPEHRRSDRDQFVHIVVHNVEKAMRPYMEPFNNTDNTEHYDYNSVMQGDKHLFARLWGLLTTIESRSKDKAIKPSSRPTQSDLNAVNRAYACPEPKTRLTPDCIETPVPAYKDSSSYSFVVDEHTVSWMRGHGYDRFRLVQVCQPAALEWWGPSSSGQAMLGDGPGGVDHPFVVDRVPRCGKGANRHVSRYALYMCQGAARCDAPCKGSENGRRVCPVLGDRHVDSKAVQVTDTKLWICHAL